MTATVTTNQSSWQVSSDAAWLTVSPASGAPGALITVTAAANTATVARSAIVTATAGTASATLTVTQAAAAPGKVKAGVVKVSGKAKVKAKLAAKRSKWASGVTFTYQWLRNGKATKKATKSTYKVTKADRGKKISVRVVAKKTGLLPATVNSKSVRIAK